MSHAKRKSEKKRERAERTKDRDLQNVRNLIKRGKAPRLHFARDRNGKIRIRFTTGLFLKGRPIVDAAKKGGTSA